MSKMDVIIAAIAQANAKKEEWPYPQAFETIKIAGAAEYTVDVSSFEIVYKGSFGTWQETWKPPVSEAASTAVKVNEHAIKEALVTALQKRMKKEITYTEFLRNIAAAGIAHYRTDMASRTVTYYDMHSQPVLVQEIPEINLKS